MKRNSLLEGDEQRMWVKSSFKRLWESQVAIRKGTQGINSGKEALGQFTHLCLQGLTDDGLGGRGSLWGGRRQLGDWQHGCCKAEGRSEEKFGREERN